MLPIISKFLLFFFPKGYFGFSKSGLKVKKAPFTAHHVLFLAITEVDVGQLPPRLFHLPGSERRPGVDLGVLGPLRWLECCTL